ncbi:MAG: hypothetical protein QM485_11910 [Flavobacteriaceae bacterium]
MTTFFTILFIMIGINAIMMFFSFGSIGQKTKKSTKQITDSSDSKIYPLDLMSSKYKKAV